MATDVLILGGFIFTDFAVPDRMPFSGKQKLDIKKMPGGLRNVDCMGPDDDDRTWKGILWGDDAFSDMLLLDAMRSSGEEMPFSWGAESRTVVIQDFKADVEKVTCIHYSITAVFTDDSGSGGGAGPTIDSLVSADLSLAVGL